MKKMVRILLVLLATCATEMPAPPTDPFRQAIVEKDYQKALELALKEAEESCWRSSRCKWQRDKVREVLGIADRSLKEEAFKQAIAEEAFEEAAEMAAFFGKERQAFIQQVHIAALKNKSYQAGKIALDYGLVPASRPVESRYFDQRGKLRETEIGRAEFAPHGGYGYDLPCDADPSERPIRICSFSDVAIESAGVKEELQKLEATFIAEGVRQNAFLKKVGGAAYCAKYNQDACGEWTSAGPEGCKLHQLVEQRDQLLKGAGVDPLLWPLWRIFIRGKMDCERVPLPERNYSPKVARKLADLRTRFLNECGRQSKGEWENRYHRGVENSSMSLLKLILEASYATVQDLSSELRKARYKEWAESECKLVTKDASLNTVRYLLSWWVRGDRSSDNPHPTRWICGAVFGLYYLDWQCGGVEFWESEEKRVDISRKLVGVVPTLPEAR